jgi:hypothetical protein
MLVEDPGTDPKCRHLHKPYPSLDEIRYIRYIRYRRYRRYRRYVPHLSDARLHGSPVGP